MKLSRIFILNKRQKLVLAVGLLSTALFAAEFLSGAELIIAAVILAFLTDIILLLILKDDIKGTFFYPTLILPFLFTLAFPIFFTLVPDRIITRLLITSLYAFGLYSLFLTQNIFAVSGIRTINLLRSARIASFVITLLVLYFLINFAFSLRLPVYITPILVFVIVFFMNFQSLWTYSLKKSQIGEIATFSFAIGIVMMELSFVLAIWPVNASIYSLFLTGIFYAYSGLSHAWLERRLFKGILWEYVWVIFISVLFLIIFSRWGA